AHHDEQAEAVAAARQRQAWIEAGAAIAQAHGDALAPHLDFEGHVAGEGAIALERDLTEGLARGGDQGVLGVERNVQRAAHADDELDGPRPLGEAAGQAEAKRPPLLETGAVGLYHHGHRPSANDALAYTDAVRADFFPIHCRCDVDLCAWSRVSASSD